MVTKKVSVSAHGYLFYHRTNDADCVSQRLYGSVVGKWKREKRRMQLTLFEALDRRDRDQAAEAAWFCLARMCSCTGRNTNKKRAACRIPGVQPVLQRKQKRSQSFSSSSMSTFNLSKVLK